MQQQQPAQQQQGQRGSNWTGMIFRMMMFYFLFNYFFKPKPTTEQVDSTGKTLPVVYNIWKEGTRFDLRVYFTESENFTEYEDNSKLVWITEDIYYDWRESNSRKISFDYIPTPTLLNNGSLFAHVFFTRSGFPYNPKSQKYDKTASFHETHPMTKYLLQKKDVRKNLISGDSDLTKEELEKKQQQLELFQNTTMQYISFWKPNLTLNLIEDQNRYPSGSLPPQFQQHMRINEQFGWFYPVIYFNEFWLFREHMIPINNTIKTLPVTIEYGLIGLIKWQMMLQMEQSFQMQQQMGTSAEGESDDIKRMLIETNPYLLAVTFIVTILHSVFDFLAFKNDIHFWKNKKNLEGMSVKTIFINTISQFIIFLYLIDNETSWIIIISAGIGLLIECWKVKKAVIVTIDWNKTIPIVFTDRESYASKTKEYDEQAMKYLSYLLFPLIVGYSIYSLMYQTHKSWYSWIISSLVGCVYTFGFIMMTPQLFINYKLKSVAHLPWRVFTYKALNTFIDDLFAFIIKMPTMHRLSCFRDDIIFLIYLYQRWTYRVDPTRVNEFGQSGLDDLLNNDNNDSNANDNVSAENDKTIKDKEEEETQNHGENEKEAEIKPADEKKKD